MRAVYLTINMAAPMCTSTRRTRAVITTSILCAIIRFSSSDVSQENCQLDDDFREREEHSGCEAMEDSSGETSRNQANENSLSLKIFSEWRFDKRQLLIENFPLDSISENYVRQVRDAVFSIVYPVPMTTATHLVAVSDPALDTLDLDGSVWDSEFFKSIVSGSTFLPGSTPLSHRYGGHQFGYWSGQLGDGRAVLLGEYVNRRGERWELQLKGSGQTPYSRRGDGRAVLRSSIREFLCSEALHHLHIPTSRALSLSVSSDPVWRDQFYDGHPRVEKAAVVLRLAPSWFRIGSLEILAKTNKLSLLRKLTDFVIEQYFPLSHSLDSSRYVSFFQEVVSQTADMIAKWMSVGFAHGVMNTDNFSLLSLTIDYGPFGFLDAYLPDFVPNTSDDEARYSYANQPDVAAFNLDKLRQTLVPLVSPGQAQQLRQILDSYAGIYKTRFLEIYRQKLGLFGEEEVDEYIVALLLKLMEDTQADYTMTFRQLGALSITDLAIDNIPEELWAVRDLQQHRNYPDWIRVYTQRAGETGEETSTENHRRARMNAVNPRYVLRNWMAEEAIRRAEEGDFSVVGSLQAILQAPYREDVEAERAGYAQRPPGWAKDIRVSCSS